MSFTSRAQDNLDLTVVVDVCVRRLRDISKGNFSKVTEKYISRLTKKRNQLESKMIAAANAPAKGIVEYLYKRKLVSRLKADLRKVNESIVQIINSIYKYFSAIGK